MEQIVKDKIEKTEKCWNWLGKKNPRGYGYICMHGRTYIIHRYVYEQLVGKIPEGLHIDHLCRNKACVNPEHLEPVTLAENNRRAVPFKIKTLCKRGHPYSNTYEDAKIKKSGQRYRPCKQCKSLSNKRHRLRLKEKRLKGVSLTLH